MPIPSILISLSQSGCAAYFMVEYQFSIYIIEDFAKKTNFKMLAHTEYSFLNLGYYPILTIFLVTLVTPMLNQPQRQMFPSEWKMIIYGSHCRTETTTPICHTHRPHPLATPTGHTHQPHLPATPSSHFH